VAVLNDRDELVNVALRDLEDDLFEQVFVVDDLVRQVKFWLKVLPDVVVLFVVDLQENLLA